MTPTPRPQLDAQRFDVVIIGGGINGAAIARELTRARKRVLVVEQHDFGSGTTSRSTRIIHGGLRYLEHGELGLVRESLHERERLLADRGHLVRPLTFLLALPPNSDRSALTVRFGLWLYGRIAQRSPIRDPKEDRRRLESLLDHGQRWSVFPYEDAQCAYPERLIVEWLVEAAACGAVVRNHNEALEVLRRDGLVIGVRLRDRLTSEEFTVQCDWVINATGPWADFLCRQSNIQTDEPLIGGVRGAHILLPLFPGAPNAAVYTEALDGRPIFVIPWAGQLMVGTTEVRDNRNPSGAAASPDEIAYLLKSFQRLFPTIGYTEQDIRAAYAGIRPLPHINERTPSSVTRRHFLIDHADDGARNLFSVIGGKLTTALSLARECARALGIIVPEPKSYAIVSAEEWKKVDITAGLDDVGTGALARPTRASARAIAVLFGSASPSVLETLHSDDRFRHPICPHTDHLIGETVYSVRHEFAVTLADILLRRVPIALDAHWSSDCTRSAATNIGRALGWTDSEAASQTEAFQDEYHRFLTKPSA